MSTDPSAFRYGDRSTDPAPIKTHLDRIPSKYRKTNRSVSSRVISDPPNSRLPIPSLNTTVRAASWARTINCKPSVPPDIVSRLSVGASPSVSIVWTPWVLVTTPTDIVNSVVGLNDGPKSSKLASANSAIYNALRLFSILVISPAAVVTIARGYLPLENAVVLADTTAAALNST